MIASAAVLARACFVDGERAAVGLGVALEVGVGLIDLLGRLDLLELVTARHPEGLLGVDELTQRVGARAVRGERGAGVIDERGGAGAGPGDAEMADEGRLARLGILAQGLARLGAVAGDVEDVVGDLEGKADGAGIGGQWPGIGAAEGLAALAENFRLRQYLFDALLGQRPDVFAQLCFVGGRYLGNDDDALLG